MMSHPMLRYILILFLSITVFTACKKDILPPKEEDKPTVQDDKRNVRILKVVQEESPNQFPFSNSTLMTVEYKYEEEKLIQIRTQKSNGENFDIDIHYLENDTIAILFPDLKSLWEPYFGTYWFKEVKFRHRYPLYEILTIYETEFPGIFYRGKKTRSVLFTTDHEQKLYAIESKFSGDNALPAWNGNGISIKNFQYHTGLLKSYQLINKMTMFSSDVNGQEFQVHFDYSKAPEIPNGLIQIINHALAGVYQFGLEDYFFHWIYDISPDNHITVMNGIKDKVIQPNYNFSDWIIGFGLNTIHALPNSNNHIISKKTQSGLKFYDIDTSNQSTNILFQNVSHAKDYKYTIDTIQKTLQIAGLKIYYEIVE